MDKIAQLVDGVKFLATKVETLEKEAADLRAQLQMHEKRAQAEEVLITARQTNSAPESLKSRSIDDFLAKRAKLESSSHEKIAQFENIVRMCESDGDGILLSDETDGAERGDFNGWLRSIQ